MPQYWEPLVAQYAGTIGKEKVLFGSDFHGRRPLAARVRRGAGETKQGR
jgi:hypothetical protein